MRFAREPLIFRIFFSRHPSLQGLVERCWSRGLMGSPLRSPNDETRRSPLRSKWLWGALVGFAFSTGCGMPSLPGGNGDGSGAGPGKRAQDIGLTPDQELDAGRRAYKEVLTEYRNQILPGNRPEVKRVRDITARIVKAAQIRPLQKEINLHFDNSRYEWEVNVVDKDEVNAFCLPGGKIVVYTGILRIAANDDEVAAVVAHEISHALAHHSAERVARDRTKGAGVLRNLSYQRMQESEADHIGVFLMTFAGYDPQASVRFWEHMQQRQQQGRMPEILSDHPSDATRAKQLAAWSENARKGKQAFDEGRVVKD